MHVVYLITNLVTGRYYVGQTRRSVEARWAEHCAYARQGRSSRLYSAVRKHPPEAFAVETLAVAASQDEANHLECLWILLLRAYDKQLGYNLTYTGTVAQPTEETRAKLSQALTGKVPWNLGKSPSPETRERMRQAHRGRQHSVATREKLRASKLGANNPNFGKARSLTSRQKQSETLRRMHASR